MVCRLCGATAFYRVGRTGYCAAHRAAAVRHTVLLRDQRDRERTEDERRDRDAAARDRKHQSARLACAFRARSGYK